MELKKNYDLTTLRNWAHYRTLSHIEANNTNNLGYLCSISSKLESIKSPFCWEKVENDCDFTSWCTWLYFSLYESFRSLHMNILCCLCSSWPKLGFPSIKTVLKSDIFLRGEFLQLRGREIHFQTINKYKIWKLLGETLCFSGGYDPSLGHPMNLSVTKNLPSWDGLEK